MSDPIDEFEMSSIASLLCDDIAGDIAFGEGKTALVELMDDGSVKIVLNESGARSLCRFLLAAQHAKRTRSTSALRRNDVKQFFPNWASAKARGDV